MKISQFNPRSEHAVFCPILHPVNDEPIKDENGVQIGFDVVSVNSRKANQSRNEMHTSILRRKNELAVEMGRPDFGIDPDPEQKKELDAWDEENKSEFETKARVIVREEFALYLSRCCLKVHGTIELDDGSVVTDAKSVMLDQEWIADQVVKFHQDMGNWVPKQPGS